METFPLKSNIQILFPSVSTSVFPAFLVFMSYPISQRLAAEWHGHPSDGGPFPGLEKSEMRNQKCPFPVPTEEGLPAVDRWPGCKAHWQKDKRPSHFLGFSVTTPLSRSSFAWTGHTNHKNSQRKMNPIDQNSLRNFFFFKLGAFYLILHLYLSRKIYDVYYVYHDV